jgi:hypothetical protein
MEREIVMVQVPEWVLEFASLIMKKSVKEVEDMLYAKTNTEENCYE